MKNILYTLSLIVLFGCCETSINIETLKQPMIITSSSLDKATGNLVKEKLLFSKQFDNLSCKNIEIYQNSIPSNNKYKMSHILHQTCGDDCSWDDSYKKITSFNLIQEMCKNSNATIIIFMSEGKVVDAGFNTYCNNYGYCGSSKVYSITQTFYPLIKTEKSK